MKKQVLSILCIIFSSYLFAQNDDQIVILKTGNLKLEKNILRGNFKKENIQSSLFKERYYLLLQFSSLPSEKLQKKLQLSDIRLEDFVSGTTYLASINTRFNFLNARDLGITTIKSFPPNFKKESRLNNFAISKKNDDLRYFAVSFYPSVDRITAEAELLKTGAVIVPAKQAGANVLFIEPDTSLVDALAAIPFVKYISIQTLKDKPLNYKNIAAHGISGLNAEVGKNLNGKNVTLGVGDNADISTHIDFAGRLINRTPWSVSDHGTHTSATAAGGGILNVKNHGMAPKATIISQFFSDIITNAPTYVADNKMVITNNSYYSSETGCAGEGEYDVLSIYADEQARSFPQLLHVVAAGNDGDNTCSPYPAKFGTVKSGWQGAKNVLTVGAIKTQDYTIASFSSRGPVNDGRIKPEICAGGWQVLSAMSFNRYDSSNGTSMAAPAVTGALALMYERYRQLHGNSDPASSLVKAIACNTAEDLGNTGPDYTFGFGMLNARKAVEAIDSSYYFVDSVGNGENKLHTITLPQSAAQLKILIHWTDKEGAINASQALVNDLDLTVTDPLAVLYNPLILNSTPANVNNLAVQGVDHINNIEQVVINNPGAGTYSININGFSLPFGKQTYTVTYEVIKPSIVVEYPFGGETLVPGEAEYIRWNAYGNSGNSYTIEYSNNNGTNWTTINNNVPLTSRIHAWTVPTAITNNALIRITENNTSVSDQSDFNFTVLGQPVVSATNVCEGATRLLWNTISGATAYEVLKLTADSMQVIASTTDTFALITGLNKAGSYWFGVRTMNGTKPGRRSISVNVTPNSGACTLAVFNDDIKVDSILEPNTARLFFANAANATGPVKIRIKNMGSVTVASPFTVSYSINGISIATENINTPISAGATIDYTFTTGYSFVSTGFNHSFKAWTGLSSDNNKNNDTAYKTVKLIANEAITNFPVTEDFESMPIAEFTTAEMAIGENQRIDFSASSPRGRARTFVNTGFARSGIRAITLDQHPANPASTVDSLTFSYNLATKATTQLRYDFFYKNHGQTDTTNNKIWIRGSENDAWIQAYDLEDNQAERGEWAHAVININEVLDNAIPSQIVTATSQIRFGEEGSTSANSPNPQSDLDHGDIDDGYTFDDITLKEAINDITAVKLIAPEVSACSLSSTETISVRIKNYNNATYNNLQVSYQVNNGSVITENIIEILPYQTIDYIFTQTANLSVYAEYAIKTWVKSPGDNYPENDSVLNFKIRSSPLISNYPYLERFESNDGYFYKKENDISWEWGTPSKTIINKAANGSKAWVTNLTADYNSNEDAYLYSPCFDLTGLTQPVLSFSHIFDLEIGYDYTWVEYSSDGINWQKLGSQGNGTNWYDTSINVWKVSKTKWHVASIDLPTTGSTIRFRFVLNSDPFVTGDGVGIDDVHIFDKAAIYSGIPLNNITQNVNGTDWTHFTAVGRNVVSINPNGNNLGSTTVQVHPYTAIVRNSNNQYYANRNIVVQSTNPPASNVSIRFYFTVAEADSLLKATGCGTCIKPFDPYELGVTKFSGNITNENNTISDNFSGYYSFILPANTDIVPYDNGYYAQFDVNSLSEFWLSKAAITPASISTCVGSTITFKAANYGSTFQWQENNGAGYTNIINGANYAGAGTNTLQLINLPASYAGYKYRCVVNGVNGPENILRFTSIWTGATNTNWFTASNWSCATLPNQYTDVIIPDGLSNYPVINANTSIKSIRVYNAASVTVQPGFILDVLGNH